MDVRKKSIDFRNREKIKGLIRFMKDQLTKKFSMPFRYLVNSISWKKPIKKEPSATLF
jgi:hypothetical protein